MLTLTLSLLNTKNMNKLPDNHPIRKRIAKQEKKAEARFSHIEAMKKERSKVATRLERGKATTKE